MSTALLKTNAWKIYLLSVLAAASLAVQALLVSDARAQACRPDGTEILVCGEGAIRIFADTISPSKRLAFSWRMRGGEPLPQDTPDREDVENVLVRVADGKVLAALGGNYWHTEKSRANRMDVIAVWSPDSRAVIEVANERWDSYAFAYYALSPDDTTVRLDLRAIVQPAMHAMMRKRQRKFDPTGYSFRVQEEKPMKLSARGQARLSAMLFLPKKDPELEVDVTLALKRKRGKLVARIVTMRAAKSN